MRWSHRSYGRVNDPIHKSHLVTIAGSYGCPRRFILDRTTPETDEALAHNQPATLGTASHAVIAAHLTSGIDGSLALSQLEFDLLEWLPQDHGIARDDIRERAEMIRGLLLHGIGRHVRRVIACEAAFIAPFGPYWLSGHVDLVFEPHTSPATIALADWKSGAQKPHVLDLEHGWEAGVYSAALRYGHFVDAAGRDRATVERALIEHAQRFGVTPTYGQFPSEIYHVALSDYVPYRKAGRKVVQRPEDLLHYGYPSARTHEYRAGELRGGAWIRVPLREGDLRRFEWRLKKVVNAVRLGTLFDMPGEQCRRCRHQQSCLNDGYTDTSAEAQQELWDLFGKDATEYDH